jgi:hypothetical protein
VTQDISTQIERARIREIKEHSRAYENVVLSKQA